MSQCSTFGVGRFSIFAMSAATLLLSPTACSAQPVGSGTAARVASAMFVAQSGDVAAGAYGGKSAAVGYYRMPSLHDDLVIFVSEGDLWKVSLTGDGQAHRLTTHQGVEGNPVISPDGSTVAFTAQYEGPSELYTMPVAGGLPTRMTFDSWTATPRGWTADGQILFMTSLYSTLPNRQLALLDPQTRSQTPVPLWQAGDGSYSGDGSTLFFHRLGQGSHTKRYQGGTAHQIWSWGGDVGRDEAVYLTADFPGTNKNPMWWDGRVYFATDRDGTMNIWSMDESGGDLQQHTRHVGYEVKSPALQNGRIIYQRGADLRLYDIAGKSDRGLTIRLNTDFDQMREKWITEPANYISAAHISPDGDRVVLTARGEIFVTPPKDGRMVQVTRRPDIRYRDARFTSDGENLLALSDESGEVEIWEIPTNGTDDRRQLTENGKVLRWSAVPSPDGKWIAHTDKNWKLWLFDTETKDDVVVEESDWGNINNVTWSSDSAWIAYEVTLENEYTQIRVLDIADQSKRPLTSDRFNSYSPAWGPDGKFLYFLSDRSFRSLVGSPWGLWRPEPVFDKTTKIYAVGLQKGLRSPFAVENELTRAEAKAKEEEEKEEDKDKDEDEDDDGDIEKADAGDTADTSGDEGDAGQLADDAVEDDDDDDGEDEDDDEEEVIEIEFDGILARIYDVPVGNGNYGGLFVAGGALYWTDRGSISDRSRDLKAMKITNEDPEATAVADGIRSAELSGDGKKLLMRKGSAFYIVKANGGKAELDEKSQVQLNGWSFPLIPREEWRQMFVDAWRLERDYFYDPKMHGVDWPAMLERYLPLVDRVSDRDELSDAIAQMVAETSTLHTFVYGGDARRGDENIQAASLGALLSRDVAAGGYRIEHIYRADPDYPNLRSPLDQLDQAIADGDLITEINGRDVFSVRDISELLRNQNGKQVLVQVQAKADGEANLFIVKPISQGAARNLRYHEWEYTRRLITEEKSDGRLGYIHLRAMGRGDIATWTRDYQPIFTRPGLVIDVRHNGGGNIDSWILERLIRQVWFYWQGRVGKPTWNMQQAFRGHLVILCDENTGSDGEAIVDGFKRLGLGLTIGKRTWGGEVWLTSSNRLVDGGIATAAEFGVYGPEGEWLIEGHGFDPDLEVDNLPHATFNGEDAQLDAAIDHLLAEIAKDPREVPGPPAHPNKSSPDNRRR